MSYQAFNTYVSEKDILVKFYHWSQLQFCLYPLFNPHTLSVVIVEKKFLAIALKLCFLHFKIICDLLLTMIYLVIYNIQIHIASENWNTLNGSAKFFPTVFQRLGTSNTAQAAAGNKIGIGMTFEECCLQEFEGVHFTCGNTSALYITEILENEKLCLKDYLFSLPFTTCCCQS